MHDDFDTFQRRMLGLSKAAADLDNWLAIGFFVSIVSGYVPTPACHSPAVTSMQNADILDVPGRQMIDVLVEYCEGTQTARLSALAWIFFSLLRIGFLASRRHAGPILQLCDLMIARDGGRPVTFPFAVRYALLEWLPFHVLSLYILFFKIPGDLYSMGTAITLTIAAQLVWLAPVVFKYRGRNMAEWSIGGGVAFNPKKQSRIEKIYQSRWKKRYQNANFYLTNIVFCLIALLGIFESVQVLRAPAVNLAYERLLYADQKPVWDHNLYFAVAGLHAPADVKDTAAYGLARAVRNFKVFEQLKQMNHIPYAYPIPDRLGTLPKIRGSEELEVKDDGWKDLSCLYAMPSARTDAESCATRQDFLSYVRANQVVWDRFNSLPDEPLYRPPPQPLGGNLYLSSLISLERLKAAQIVDFAEKGEADQAFREWNKYMHLYRSMAGAREGMVAKAVIKIMISMHMTAFEKLLYLHPDLARTYSADIDAVLKPTGNDFFRTDYMLSDDLGLMEPVGSIGLMGNVNAIRNDLYVCILNFQNLARLPMDQYPFARNHQWCRLQDMSFLDEAGIYPLTRPGYFISNVVESLMMGGLLKGEGLVGNLKLFDVQLRMDLAGVAVLKRDVPAADVPAFLATLPEELQNPVTRKPFEWDGKAKSLFFVRPDNSKRVEFHLNI